MPSVFQEKALQNLNVKQVLCRNVPEALRSCCKILDQGDKIFVIPSVNGKKLPTHTRNNTVKKFRKSEFLLCTMQ